MKIIAQRDKTLGKILFIFGFVLIVLSAFALTISFLYIVTLILGLILSLISIFNLAQPKNAILKDGEYIIIRYTFSQARIKASEIEYTKYDEIGEFRHRRSFLGALYLLKNDVRRLTITVRQESLLKHYEVWSILNASAVATEIEAIVEKAKKN